MKPGLFLPSEEYSQQVLLEQARHRDMIELYAHEIIPNLTVHNG